MYVWGRGLIIRGRGGKDMSGCSLVIISGCGRGRGRQVGSFYLLFEYFQRCHKDVDLWP